MRPIRGDEGICVAGVEVGLCFSGGFLCLAKPTCSEVSDGKLQLRQSLEVASLFQRDACGQVGRPRLLPPTG